ncbi:MAG: N-acetylmuramoyl-L-alanine amidase [Deltaproteobacteria bacterium]|nr:N-acetylmuramoyl-L-alanine amidase [Deltaproteobacteria bacterium]
MSTTRLLRWLAPLSLAFACAPSGGLHSLDPDAEGDPAHGDAEQVLTGAEIVDSWTELDDYLLAPGVSAPEGANRVAVLVTMGTPDLTPRLEARAVEGGVASGTWQPVEWTWSEHDQHVGIVDFGTIVDGAQVRMPPADAEMIRQIRWSATYVDESAAVGDASDALVGSRSDALAGELAAAGVVSRASWGARSTRCSSRNPSKHRMAIHHTVTGATNPERQVRGIQAYHMDGRGWCDVGYHFLIGTDGTVFEGRPLDLLGAHVGGHNTGNIGISLVGCFQNSGCAGLSGPRTPPAAMICAAGQLANVLSSRFGITVNDGSLRGHTQHGGASTSCPGANTLPLLGDIRAIARSGMCDGSAPPPTAPPPTSAGRCVHSNGGVYGDRACSAGWQCCGGSWTTRDAGCGSCACTEASGSVGCEGEAAPPPETSACVHSFGGTYPERGCSAGYQCCDGRWQEGAGSCGSCACTEASGTEGCSPEPAPAPEPEPATAPPGASCVHSYGGVYANTACSAGWQCCDGRWQEGPGSCGRCACTEETGTEGCGQSACEGGGEGTHAGLSQGGAEIPRAGLSNDTLRRTLGVGTEPYGDQVIHEGLPYVRGKISWFGSPDDRSIPTSGTGAITGERVRYLNDPVDPSAETLAARPADYYWIAMRWNYEPRGREFWRNARFVLTNPATGASVVARAVDWGPHTRTRRVVDVSPQVMSDLGLVTDQDVLVAFAAPGTALGPAEAAACEPSAEACAEATACGACNGVAGCGWCEASGECVPDSERASCGEPDWRDEPSACEPCDFSDCGSCADSGYCSWCPGVGCINDAIDHEVAMCGGEPIATAAGC